MNHFSRIDPVCDNLTSETELNTVTIYRNIA